jgi:hypothetical protein
MISRSRASSCQIQEGGCQIQEGGCQTERSGGRACRHYHRCAPAAPASQQGPSLQLPAGVWGKKGKPKKRKENKRARACRHSRRYRAVAASRAVAVTVSRSSLPSHCKGASRAIAAAARGKSCQSLFTSSPVPAELERACRHLPRQRPAGPSLPAQDHCSLPAGSWLAASRVIVRCQKQKCADMRMATRVAPKKVRSQPEGLSVAA